MIRTYDLLLKTRTTGLDVSNGSAELVRGFIVDSLRCWGIPVPDLVQDAEKFAAELRRTGVYTHDDVPRGAYVRVRRARSPGEEHFHLQFAPKSTPPAGRATAP